MRPDSSTDKDLQRCDECESPKLEPPHRPWVPATRGRRLEHSQDPCLFPARADREAQRGSQISFVCLLTQRTLGRCLAFQTLLCATHRANCSNAADARTWEVLHRLKYHPHGA